MTVNELIERLHKEDPGAKVCVGLCLVIPHEDDQGMYYSYSTSNFSVRDEGEAVVIEGDELDKKGAIIVKTGVFPIVRLTGYLVHYNTSLHGKYIKRKETAMAGIGAEPTTKPMNPELIEDEEMNLLVLSLLGAVRTYYSNSENLAQYNMQKENAVRTDTARR